MKKRDLILLSAATVAIIAVGCSSGSGSGATVYSASMLSKAPGSVSKALVYDAQGTSNPLRANGTFNLTPKWPMTANSPMYIDANFDGVVNAGDYQIENSTYTTITDQLATLTPLITYLNDKDSAAFAVQYGISNVDYLNLDAYEITKQLTGDDRINTLAALYSAEADLENSDQTFDGVYDQMKAIVESALAQSDANKAPSLNDNDTDDNDTTPPSDEDVTDALAAITEQTALIVGVTILTDETAKEAVSAIDKAISDATEEAEKPNDNDTDDNDSDDNITG